MDYFTVINDHWRGWYADEPKDCVYTLNFPDEISARLAAVEAAVRYKVNEKEKEQQNV